MLAKPNPAFAVDLKVIDTALPRNNSIWKALPPASASRNAIGTRSDTMPAEKSFEVPFAVQRSSNVRDDGSARADGKCEFRPRDDARAHMILRAGLPDRGSRYHADAGC